MLDEPDRDPDGLRAPAPPGRGAVPARPRPRRRHRRLRRGRPRASRATVPADIVGYGGWLTALIVAAHVTVRVVAPYADPVLLPLVAALNGLGLAILRRLDLTYEAHRRPAHLRPPAADLDDARRRPLHRHAGPAARPPRAAALHLHRRPDRHRAADPAVPPAHRPRDQRCPHLDQRRRLQLPARRGRQGAAGDRVLRLPRPAPRRPRARRSAGGLRRPARAGATSARSWRCSASR